MRREGGSGRACELPRYVSFESRVTWSPNRLPGMFVSWREWVGFRVRERSEAETGVRTGGAEHDYRLKSSDSGGNAAPPFD